MTVPQSVCLWLVSEPSFQDLVYRSRRVVPTGWEGVNVVNWSSHRHVSTLTTTTTSASTLMPTKSPSALDLRRDLFLQAEKAQGPQMFSSFFSSFVRESQISWLSLPIEPNISRDHGFWDLDKTIYSSSFLHSLPALCLAKTGWMKFSAKVVTGWAVVVV